MFVIRRRYGRETYLEFGAVCFVSRLDDQVDTVSDGRLVCGRVPITTRVRPAALIFFNVLLAARMVAYLRYVGCSSPYVVVRSSEVV
jgi:hypothetical protein